MLNIIRERLRQGRRTISYPAGDPPALSDRFRGLPVLKDEACPEGCKVCAEVCPTQAIGFDDEGLNLDLGRCLFCGACEETCPNGVIRFSSDHRMAVTRREDLVVRPERSYSLASPLEARERSLFGRSLKLRQVCAGGDGSCEADLNVLGTVVFDIGRFGIQFVASPRHADALVVTGPITRNMVLAVNKTYEATPAPKLVIAVGVDALSGGVFRGHPEACDGLQNMLPIALFIPGNPPHPLTILDGLLRLLGRLKREG